MALIILKQLDYRVRNEKGIPTEPLAAFIGATDGDLAEFGIGLVNEEGKASFWGMLHPHRLITAWRGMHVLDKVENIYHGTLCACYYAGLRELSGDDKERVDELGKQIDGLDELRERLLNTVLTDELEEILKFCNDPGNQIHLATWEFTEEIKAGTIAMTSELQRVFDLEREAQELYQSNTAKSEEPLADAESFEKFCVEAGIGYLCDYPFGAYGWDWGHWKLEGLDTNIVMRGLQFGYGEVIYCTEYPESSDDFGAIGHPVLTMSNGAITTVLIKVQYEDNRMIAYLSELNGDSKTTPMDLSALRELSPRMIGIAHYVKDASSTEDNKIGRYVLAKTVEPRHLTMSKKEESTKKGFFARLFGFFARLFGKLFGK